MSLADAGLPALAVALLATTIAYAFALYRRSWSWWLVAFGLTLVSLVIAWCVRAPPIDAVTIFAEASGT